MSYWFHIVRCTYLVNWIKLFRFLIEFRLMRRRARRVRQKETRIESWSEGQNAYRRRRRRHSHVCNPEGHENVSRFSATSTIPGGYSWNRVQLLVIPSKVSLTYLSAQVSFVTCIVRSRSSPQSLQHRGLDNFSISSYWNSTCLSSGTVIFSNEIIVKYSKV